MFLIGLERAKLARLSGQEAPGSACLCSLLSPSAGIASAYHYAWLLFFDFLFVVVFLAPTGPELAM